MTTGTLGIDLAAKAPRTAGCMIEWDDTGSGMVHCPSSDYQDTDIFAKLVDTEYVSRVAIDAPFGWPLPFLETISLYQQEGIWPVSYESEEVVRDLRLRATDQAIRLGLGLTPLSVSTDRIGVVAMRCARLLAAAQAELGRPIDRTGHGRFVEVYPAAALLVWQISPKDSDDPGSYKGPGLAARARRERIVAQIVEATSRWLEIGEKVKAVCADDDNCLDAFICALIARAADRNHLQPVQDEVGKAATEGWIRLPEPGSLSLLGSTTADRSR